MLDVTLHFRNNREPKYFISPAGNHRGSTQTIQEIHEWDFFLTYLENNLKINSFIEVGTAWGGSLYGFAQISSPDATIITIDDNSKNCKFEDLQDKENKIREYGKPGQKMHFIHMDSHSQGCDDKVKSILGDSKVDFLFIDGDHSYDGVKADYQTYSKYVREGGCIGFHDVAGFQEQEGVKRHWDEIKGDYVHMEVLWLTRRRGLGLLHFTKDIDGQDPIDFFHTKDRKVV